ncbi:MAG: tetratricopeptide repeat protein [Armatimonadaceae bacterium]|jgi:tetratricopeptide (TPR) repeat protein
MPLQQFFEEQVRSLRIFLNTRGCGMRVVLSDPDTKTITHKLLAGLENDDRVTAVLVPTDAPFADAATFCRKVYADVVDSYQPFAVPLEAEYILPPPAWESLKSPDPAERLARGLAMFANALPEDVGAVAVVLDPSEVTNAAEYRRVLAHLKGNTPSEWVKYVVIDDRLNGHTVDLVMSDDAVQAQSMHLPPAEIEARAKQALAAGLVTAAERLAYTGLLASFAAARKEYGVALDLYTRQLELAEASGTPGDLAGVQYNLGNTYLAMSDHTAAALTYSDGLKLAMTANLPALVPMLLTNLGVTLFHGGAPEKAVECFATARVYARNLNQPPTEAHILDSLAKCHALAGQHAEAEKCWAEALATYDKISAPPLAYARDGGKRLIHLQLEQHYAKTRQADKLTAVRKELARG